MSSNESTRPRRNPTRNGSSSSASSSQQNSTSNSTSRPIRSTRLKATNHVNLVDDSSDESGSEEIKPLKSVNMKKIASTSSSSSTTNGHCSSSSQSNSKIDIDKLAKLESITGLSRSEAIQLLEASGNKLETAIDLHFNSNTNSKLTSSSNKRTFNHVEDSNSNEPTYYSEENVRAPIPQKTEKLLDYDPYALVVEPQAKRVRSAFDGYRDDGPFEGAASSSNSSKAKSLSALYKPPVDLLFKGSFESSKTEGCKKNKWIMLNVQDQSDFACQCLNRDLWREDTVKEIIKANFIFVQVYFDSIDGKKMINYYRINSYPFLAILDPRTGENVLQFNNTIKMDHFMFCEKVTNFLSEHDSPIKDFDENQEDKNEVVQVIDEEDSKDCILLNGKNSNSKSVKASELIKELNGDQSNEHILINSDSNSSEENIKFVKSKSKTTRLDSSSENEDESDTVVKKSNEEEKIKLSENYQPKCIRYETPDTQIRNCVLRILYPNGDRLDYCTNGDSKFKELAEYLNKQGYKKKTHELIERLMPNIQVNPSTSKSTNLEQTTDTNMNLSQTSKISNDLSNLIITNQSRNLFNFENENFTFKDLNLFPRVFLLLQEY